MHADHILEISGWEEYLILSEHPCKGAGPSIPLKSWSNQVWAGRKCWKLKKIIIFNCEFSTELICAFVLQETL